ncbi:MAG: hypothetical protein N4A45_06835 [Flavobacteriales bacterium]|jgi:hypothetical protein|nr:hypothetical protein [Flavobacteriales bacterium]
MKRSDWKNIIIGVLIILLVILLFIFTLGQADLTTKDSELEDKEDLKRKHAVSNLQYRHQKLKVIVEKKEGLWKKLRRIFSIIYFGVRLSLSAIYIGFNVILYYEFNITKLSELLNWNQLALLVISLVSFMIFGTIANVKEFISKIKYWLELKIFSKYVDINQQITKHENEMLAINDEISKAENALMLKTNSNLDNNDNLMS